MNVRHNVPSNAPVVLDKTSDLPLRIVQQGLLPLSLALWGIGISRTNVSHLGSYGLPAALPLIYYLGILTLLASMGIEFSRKQPSEIRLAIHSCALVVMIYATAPLLYKDGRYSWLYKTTGVVQYIGAHGSLNTSIDIYQKWPGFFALASWFDKVAGVTSPLDYAKWAQPVFELAAIPLLYSIYRSLSLSVWNRWLAIVLYSATNWIAQDYFSPQAVATLLSLGIMAVTTHWVFAVHPRGRERSSLPVRPSAPGMRDAEHKRKQQIKATTQHLVPLALLFAILTVTHELSPYIIAIQIAVLVLIWLPQARKLTFVTIIIVAGIALAYLIPNYSYLEKNYGLTYSFGHFFSNVRAPSLGSGATPPPSHRFIGDCAYLLTGGVWLLAIAAAFRKQNSRRLVIALLAMTFTPIIILIPESYGNEGILRVYLFSLPWAVALASIGIVPLLRTHLEDPLRSLRVIIPVAAALILFYPAFFGNDAAYMMPSDEVETVTNFMQTAKPGPILAAIDNWPSSDTANYDEYRVGSIFDSPGFITPEQQRTGIAAFLARTLGYNFPNQPVYIIAAPSMIAYNSDFGVTSPENMSLLESSLAHSPYWHLVVGHDGTVIYTLVRSAFRHISGGPQSENLSMSVP